MKKAITLLLWIVFAVGAVGMILRLVYGLGWTTGLNDGMGWGLWTALKLAFIGVAGGAFTIAFVAHVVHKHTYEKVARVAVLTGLLGYSLFGVLLMWDLGIPHRIVHPLWPAFFQHKSMLFEIAWCVVLYLSVLVLEFAPSMLERFKMEGLLKLVNFFMPILIFGGIVLSILHQTSLGNLFQSMEYRLPGLYYSPFVGGLFVISAMYGGVACVVVASIWGNKYRDAGIAQDTLGKVASIAGYILVFYILFRIFTFFFAGNVENTAIDWTMFIIEVALFNIAPAILLLSKSVHKSSKKLVIAGVLGMGGAIMLRFNATLLNTDPAGTSYFPSFWEIVIALGFISMWPLAFMLLTKWFYVFHSRSEARKLGKEAA